MQTIIDTFSTLDWVMISNIALFLIAAIAGGFWAIAKGRIRAMGNLLISFADAVEDNKIDANEKTDLAEKAREILKK